MDDRRLEVLIATVKHGSFSKASESLNCTQAAVTQTMNALEKELNCKLLNRTHSGVTLTDDGEILYPYILEADKSICALKIQAERIVAKKKHYIRIGTFSSMANTWLPKMISQYQKKYPDAEFEIRIGTDNVSGWLVDGSIDLAIGDDDRLDKFRFFPLMNDPFYAVLPKSFVSEDANEILQEDLSSFPFIMAPTTALQSHLSVLPTEHMRVVCDSGFTLLTMIEQGLGATVLAGLNLVDCRHNVAVLKLKPETSRIIGVALPNKPAQNAKRFLSFLKETLPTSTTKLTLNNSPT